MKIDLLDTPLRATWDLCGTEPLLTSDQVVAVACRLGEAGLFYLTLEKQALTHPALDRVLDELGGAGVKASLVYSASEAERCRLKPGFQLAKLWLDAAAFIEGGDLDEETLESELRLLRDSGYDPLLLLVPVRENLHLLQDLISLCRRLRVGSFKLPNVPIDDNFSCAAGSLIGSEDLDFLARCQTGIGKEAAAVKLEIHDRFIWELLSGASAAEHSEYGGCQAANSLMHIDCRGGVYPCSSWPQSLGNILETSLEEIWAGPGRLRVRREIDSVPSGCRGCRDYELCRGACRGLGRSVNRASGGRDPACAGSR